jgi:hypothetical protein
MKIFSVLAATAITGVPFLTATPASASIRFDLDGEIKGMQYCNDGDPYIYANTSTVWNKAYSNSSFTRTTDGKVSRGGCKYAVLDTANDYPNDIPGYEILRGNKASEALAMGWDVLLNQSNSNPSKYDKPRNIAAGCRGQVTKIPMVRVIKFCLY